MPSSDFPNGFADGLTIQNTPLTITNPGQTFYVNNSTVPAPYGKVGSNINKGTRRLPFSTLAGALALCVADRGDMIILAPGHAESFASAAAININVAGVTILGLGYGADRPTFTATTATTATLALAAQGITLKNVIIQSNIASLAKAVTVLGKNIGLEDVMFQEGSATMLKAISVGTADNDSDYFHMDRCEFYQPTTSSGASDGVIINKAMLGIRIRDTRFYGDYSNAAIGAPTSALQTNIVIERATIHNTHAAAYGFRFQTSGGKGVIRNSNVRGDTQANALVGDTILGDNVSWADLTSTNKTSIPALATVASTVGTTVQSALPFVVTKNLVSSAITTAGVTALTANSIGSVMILDYVLRTDATGLAAGTNFTLTTNDVNGAAVVSTAAVANLGANASLSKNQLTAATNGSFTLEASKVLTAKCTGSNCTGAGTISIDFYCIPATAGASVS